MTTGRATISISLDGMVGGPGISVADPMGIGGMRLHEGNARGGQEYQDLKAFWRVTPTLNTCLEKTSNGT